MKALWEDLFRQKMATASDDPAHDPAHDLSHIERVVACAKRLATAEKAALDVVVPAAWLHDFVAIAKDDPRRSQASRISAVEAVAWLRSVDYPAEFYDDIAHAIEAHSFSANIECRTVEARIVQDADRLDGLGAIGLARLFIVAGLMRRQIYSDIDPFCVSRVVDDSQFTIDHIYRKLFVVADSLKTRAGQAEGLRRRQVIERYLADLALEIV